MTREPEWDADERAWMLGLSQREDAECGRCGGDLHETTDAETWRWDPQPPVVCLRCVALAAQEEAYKEHHERAGLIYQVRKVLRVLRTTNRG